MVMRGIAVEGEASATSESQPNYHTFLTATPPAAGRTPSSPPPPSPPASWSSTTSAGTVAGQGCWTGNKIKKVLQRQDDVLGI
jgi:hypothetical protein